MKIQIGSIFQAYDHSCKALNIPGLGVMLAIPDQEEMPFECVILNRKDLLKLRKEINKELLSKK